MLSLLLLLNAVKLSHHPQQQPALDKHMKKEYIFKYNRELIIQITLITILLLLISYNVGRVWGNNISINTKSITGLFTSSIIPSGLPAVYGKELGIRYDDVSPNDPAKADQTIAVLKNLD